MLCDCGSLRQNFLASGLYTGYYSPSPSFLRLRGGGRVRKRQVMNIGETIRNFRLQKGMSQGDIEKRTGLLRCYLSRVENGHTVPSLVTLAKIASSLDMPLGQFFAESSGDGAGDGKSLPQLSEEEVRFLSQVRRYSGGLNDSDRKLVLAMVKKMAVSTGR